MFCEPMALMVINKINGELKLIYRKNRYLTKELDRIFCNAFIQPHFDYARPGVLMKPGILISMKKQKCKIMQNKSICFCFKLDKMHHISEEKFRLINWLPTRKG